MRDFEARFPWHQLDLSPPYRAYQRVALVRTGEAHASETAQQPRGYDVRAGLLQNLSAKSLFPGLIAFGTTPWPTPPLAILADQHNAIVGGHAESARSLRSTFRNRRRRMPGRQPIG